MYESDYHRKSVFVTLSYSDDFLPENGTLVKKDLQDFFKRVRKHYFGNEKSDLKYYCCGEYGPKTLRPHYHLAVFGVDFDSEKWKPFKPNHYYSPTLLELWPFGFNEVGFLTPNRMNYVAGYIQKKLLGSSMREYADRGVIPPFQLFSKEFGLNGMLKDSERLVDLFLSDKGKALPKYYTLKLGLNKVTDADGYQLSSLRYLERENEERLKHPELSDFEYAKLVVSKRLQEEIDLETRFSMLNSRGNL